MERAESANKRKRSREERTPPNKNDEDITDPSSDEGSSMGEDEAVDGSNDEELRSDEEFEEENPADKRRRLAKQYLENLKTEANDIVTKSVQDDTSDKYTQIDDYNNFNAEDLDREIIATRLKQDVAEQQGRVYRFIADKLLISEAKTSFTRVGENGLTSLSCHQPIANRFELNDRIVNNKNANKIFAYTVSKDLQLTKYDISDFTQRPKKLNNVRGGKKFVPESNLGFENTTEGHYDEILTVAASSDGRYVVTGGKDKKLIVWSTESLAPVKVIPTKSNKGEVMSIIFRKGTDQLYAACADFKVRTYSINQFSQLETLYGHHDLVIDISALSLERCVTVGARDRTAMLWKIPDETRLTFRGGEDTNKLFKKWMNQNATEKQDGTIEYPDESEAPVFYGEGSIDVVSMIDDSHFVTGSDNGNLCLWSLAKKKPLFIERAAHGILPIPDDKQVSGEASEEIRKAQMQNNKITKPYWITSVHAIPYSNIFISGSWNGSLKVWKLNENLREFSLLGELNNCKGVVTKIQAVESGKHGRETFRILATVAKEHKLGRWIDHVPGARNGIYSATVEQTSF
ncbi:hypothetical protein TPHA_0D04170 [Tetrapisispora phaffii CBS 4417]|uniref:Uncharacterized protein n=1 Tax=Tetrapisispora phaffii (strain ATCC 24235 / CBS 4417 / NBRC 1672 / NRRL Y-8282 / UCD 70-5) TaxID=1071381 RepID=G8BRX5_TETPH|nr:hypothetical protein TPHA_0D04170 [Tetrapisispora phaffii CBS 4417]CCE63050.1 hypothetical protein TPHA_0D04170 [Tetrapisispora phaffii CBS 4417]